MLKQLVKLSGLVVMFILLLNFEALALEAGKQKIDITVTQSYVSRYIWRGQDIFADGDGAQQPSVDILLPKALKGADLGFNVWTSIPANRGHQDLQEIDYTTRLAKNVFNDWLNLSCGYTYYDYPNANRKADISEPWMLVTLNKIPGLPINISMPLFAGYDFKVDKEGPDEGWYYSWGFATALNLPKLPIFQKDQLINFSITNWGQDGVANLKPCALYATEFSSSLTYSFKGFNFTPNLQYTLNHRKEINNGHAEIWGGLKVAYVF